MPEIPEALAGALADRYRIDRELGAGGMARVYLARDLKHDRDVALKVLREDVAASIGAERFLTEIRTTARLRHPHILPLFDSGSAGGAPFYVMPYVDGETLRARVRRTGPLPIDEALRILRQVSEALAYAHASGLIHRDIKADNVLLAGHDAFLADFGIARAFAIQDPAATATASGFAVGTPAYMAPEQIVGGKVDLRADMYALGALAYEMLTGAPPFAGDAQAIAAAHLTRTPDPIERRRPGIPDALADVIGRCLEKSPERRPQHADDMLKALETIAVGARAPAPPALRRLAPAVLVLILLIAAAAGWYLTRGGKPPSLTVGRLTHVTTDPGLELDPALSPDARMIAYAAGAPGQTRIYVRELAGGRAVPISDDASLGSQRWPQWSPDGSRILFQAGENAVLNESSIAAQPASVYVGTPLSGSARKLPVQLPGGRAFAASWSPDGDTVVFSTGEGLYTARADGHGPPRRIVAGADLHSAQWSPDGTLIAYVSGNSLFTFGKEKLGNVGTSTIEVFDVASGIARSITGRDVLNANPVWMPDSRTLVFISGRGGGRDVYAVELRADGRAAREPERLTSGVGAHGVSVSRNGHLLLYSAYAPNANIWSIAIPSAGAVSVADAQQLTFGNEKIEKLAVSPDGQWLAYDSDVNGVADVWKMPLSGGRPEQVTHGPYHKFVNDWSPDGAEIVYHSIQEGGQRDLFVVTADGAHTERVTSNPAEEQHAGWGPDGNSIVFDSAPPGTNASHAMIVTRARRGGPWSPPRRLTQGHSGDPKWSPTQPLIAYCADGELRLITPDAGGERILVKAAGAGDPEPAYPVWSRDGRALYYKAYDRERTSTIWGVPVDSGPPRLLVRFDVPSRRSLRREFATDGRRFYFTIARDESDLWSLELIRGGR
jgi:Tol biopolymer transport system component